MGIIKTEEFEKDGCIYIRNTYNNGTIEEYIKTDESTLPEPTQPPVTNEDIMNKLNDMSGDQVSVASLDAAYREGVNSVQ